MMSEKLARLFWSDEFNGAFGTGPDPASWRHEVGGHGWGNGELQTYTDRPDNAFQDGNGNLVIRVLRTPTGYTSARIQTKDLVDFQFGRVVIRAKLPKGAGLWSAFWALGANIDTVSWPGCGEIDIMENLGKEPRRVFGTIHCPGHARELGLSSEITASEELTSDFYLYSVQWTSEDIVWMIDDTPYHRIDKSLLGPSWVFDHPFYLLINVAVGGWLGGKVDPNLEFPCDLKIDYVRIYRP